MWLKLAAVNVQLHLGGCFLQFEMVYYFQQEFTTLAVKDSSDKIDCDLPECYLTPEAVVRCVKCIAGGTRKLTMKPVA